MTLSVYLRARGDVEVGLSAPDLTYTRMRLQLRVQRVLSCVQIRMHGMTGRCDCVSESKPRQAIMIVMLVVVGSR